MVKLTVINMLGLYGVVFRFFMVSKLWLHQTFGQATWDEWVMNWSPHRDIGNPWGHEA